MPARVEIDCAELRRFYEEDGIGTVALARHYGCSPTTISKRLHECQVQVRPSRFTPSNVSPEDLRQLYEVERLPLKVIAHRLGISISTISNLRRAHNIPVRPRRAIPKKPTL